MFLGERVDEIVDNIDKYFAARDKEKEADEYSDTEGENSDDNGKGSQNANSDDDDGGSDEFHMTTEEEARRKKEIDRFAEAFYKAWIIRIIRGSMKKLIYRLTEKRKKTFGVAGRELDEDIECFSGIHEAVKHWVPLLEQKLMMLAPHISESDIAEQGTLAKALGGLVKQSRSYAEHKKLWTELKNSFSSEHTSVKASIVGYMQRVAQDEKPTNFEVVSSMVRISFPKQITTFCVSVSHFLPHTIIHQHKAIPYFSHSCLCFFFFFLLTE